MEATKPLYCGVKRTSKLQDGFAGPRTGRGSSKRGPASRIFIESMNHCNRSLRDPWCQLRTGANPGPRVLTVGKRFRRNRVSLTLALKCSSSRSGMTHPRSAPAEPAMDKDALPEGDQPIERRLATILMADVANYSAMMGENEERTVQVLRGHRQIFDELLKAHRGRIFNTAGDSVLAEFPSAVEAVRCATEIQAALHTRNQHLPPEQRMSFRIGINLGDVIVQAGDLLGDGVNVAARIQSITEPGGVCISGSVYDQIQNKLTLQFKQLGEQTFKNIAQPIRTFSISASDAMALPFVAKRQGRPIWAGAAIAAVVVGLALAGGYAAYRSHEASVAEEARRAGEAQQAAQQRQAEESRAAIEAAKREATLQAELKAAKDAAENAAATKKADEQRRLSEAATRRVAETATPKVREDQARVAAAAPQPAAAVPEVAASAPNTPAGGLDRYDGIYSGQLCNMFVEPEPKTVCWGVAMKVEQGVMLASWMNPKAGQLDSARGKISPQGKVDMTLEGHGPSGNVGHALMMGTISGTDITASGAWGNGLRVTGKWTRTP
jgi:class 3 adenylate cyclase